MRVWLEVPEGFTGSDKRVWWDEIEQEEAVLKGFMDNCAVVLRSDGSFLEVDLAHIRAIDPMEQT